MATINSSSSSSIIFYFYSRLLYFGKDSSNPFCLADQPLLGYHLYLYYIYHHHPNETRDVIQQMQKLIHKSPNWQSFVETAFILCVLAKSVCNKQIHALILNFEEY